MPYLCQRMGCHKTKYVAFHNGKSNGNKSSFYMLDFDDAKIMLIELYPCNSKDELTAREQYWMDLTPDLIVNKLKAYVGEDKVKYKQQLHRIYYDANRDTILAKERIYREQNRERINDARRLDYEENKEKYKKYRDEHKEQTCKKDKIYRDNNQEKLKEVSKVYYEKNKEVVKEKVSIYRKQNEDKIKARRNEMKQCDCGMEYSHSNYNRHCKSKRHQEYEQNK